MKLFRIIFLLLFVCGFFCHSSSMAQELEEEYYDPSIRVMTFNVLNSNIKRPKVEWDDRKELVITQIEEYGPDILGLQESNAKQLRYIRKKLDGYGDVSNPRQKDGEYGEISSIFYWKDRFEVEEHGAFWFSDTPDVRGTTGREQAPRYCNWVLFYDYYTDGYLYVYNTHFEPRIRKLKLKAVEVLIDKIQNREYDEPFLLIGDFNEPTRMFAEAFKRLGSSIKLKDTFLELYPDATMIGTHHDFTGIGDKEMIDHIYVEPETEVIEAGIIRTNYDGMYPSDHFPVHATVILRSYEE